MIENHPASGTDAAKLNVGEAARQKLSAEGIIVFLRDDKQQTPLGNGQNGLPVRPFLEDKIFHTLHERSKDKEANDITVVVI